MRIILDCNFVRKLYLWIIITLIYGYSINVQAAKSALCFLTRSLASETLEFAQVLAEDALQYDVEVFIMIDNNNFIPPKIDTSLNLQLLQIANEQCLQDNCTDNIWLSDSQFVTSRNKALFYFTSFNLNHSFVWLCEDDVFIPSTQAFRSLHELYSPRNDLIGSTIRYNLFGDTSGWLWPMAVGKFVPPWTHSLTNIIGLSRRMLTAVDNFVQWLGDVPFHELLFNTLAMQLNLNIVTPTELSTDTYLIQYSFEAVRKRPNNFFHRVEVFLTHKQWRKRLAMEKVIKNIDIEWTDLETFCRENDDGKSMEQQVIDVFAKFDVCKSKYSADDRRLLRERFSELAQRCQKQNVSEQTVSLAMKLADHAYKLPEFPIGELISKKSAQHFELERALEANRQSVSRVKSNSSMLMKLQIERNRIVKQLTMEIQRECKEQPGFQNRTSPSISYIFSSSDDDDDTLMEVYEEFHEL